MALDDQDGFRLELLQTPIFVSALEDDGALGIGLRDPSPHVLDHLISTMLQMAGVMPQYYAGANDASKYHARAHGG